MFVLAVYRLSLGSRFLFAQNPDTPAPTALTHQLLRHAVVPVRFILRANRGMGVVNNYGKAQPDESFAYDAEASDQPFQDY
jgi:hypothetical protein